MNVKVNTIGGGIFSKFMIGVQSVYGKITVNNIDNFYIDIDWSAVDKKRQKPLNENPFDWVLEQDKNLNFHKKIKGRNSGIHSMFLQNPNFDIKFSGIKSLVGKLKIKKEILDKIKKEIDENTLGVHIRLTDMNKIHPQYGKLTTDSFKRKIEAVLKDSGKEKIFVASDNIGSIHKLSEHFDVLYNDVNNRCNKENDTNYCNFLRENSDNKDLWLDTFLDMVSLSKCGELIYTPSNLSIASVLFSNSINIKHKI